MVATGGWDMTARVWEAVSGREAMRIEHRDVVTTVAFSPDGKYVASGSCDSTARVWEVQSGKEMVRIELGDCVNSIAFSPDGKWLATASRKVAAIHILRPDELVARLQSRLTRDFLPGGWGRYLSAGCFQEFGPLTRP
jgi:WD40 repeat protein